MLREVALGNFVLKGVLKRFSLLSGFEGKIIFVLLQPTNYFFLSRDFHELEALQENT